MSFISTVVKIGLGIMAPPLTIFIQVLSSIKKWRPSANEVIIFTLLLFVTIQTIRINGLHIESHIGPFHIKFVSIEGFKEEVSSLNKQLQDRISKENIAKQAQTLINQTTQVESANIAEKINDQSDTYKESVNKAVDGYIRNHRISKCGSVQYVPYSNSSGSADMSTSDSVTKSSNTENLPSGMVVIPTSDLKGLSDNTRDADEMRAYFKYLIDNKIAVSWDNRPNKK